MSYLAETVKNLVQRKMNAETDLKYAHTLLERSEARLEEVDQEIQKAVQAAKILEEEAAISQSVYDTYPDVDVTQWGLPVAKHRPLDAEPQIAPHITEGETQNVEEAE